MNTTGKKFALRAAVAAAATAATALTLASPASAGTYDKWIAVTCPPPLSQECNATGGIDVPADGGMFVTFTGDSRAGCASIIEHVLVNGVEFASKQVAPGQDDVGVYIEESDIPQWPDRKYHVAIRADGVLGGCNTGSMSGWAGQLHVETGADA
jgi:hypothetical protein